MMLSIRHNKKPHRLTVKKRYYEKGISGNERLQTSKVLVLMDLIRNKLSDSSKQQISMKRFLVL